VRLLRKLARDKIGMLSCVVFVGIVAMALLAPIISSYDPLQFNYDETYSPPTRAHLLGTDGFGRDVLARVLYGARISLKLSLSTLAMSLVFAVPLGMAVGFSGGITEAIVMRGIDVMLVFPPTLIAIVVMAILGPGELSVILALSSYTLPQFVRLARASTLSIKKSGYVEASRNMGAGRFHIIRKHIWPNISAPVIVQATLMVPLLVLTASALSFLGLGIQPPTPEWGAMLYDAKKAMRYAPYLMIGPGLALSLFVLSANLLGDSIQKIVNPRLTRL